VWQCALMYRTTPCATAPGMECTAPRRALPHHAVPYRTTEGTCATAPGIVCDQSQPISLATRSAMAASAQAATTVEPVPPMDAERVAAARVVRCPLMAASPARASL
jgi:hypothetical protein